MKTAFVIIPARYGASRFPGKPLALLRGKPLIGHVVERALRARGVARVAVATDDERIAAAARACGAEAVMTGPAPSGTDRVAEAARALPPADFYVNLQGDEPLIEPAAIEILLEVMQSGQVEMATLSRLLEPGERERPQVVKVVSAANGDALYFSRAPIPHRRQGGESPLARAHVGIYAFRADFLQAFTRLPAGRLEQEESLEQLRALEHGHRIKVLETGYRGFGVDTPEDLERAHALLSEA